MRLIYTKNPSKSAVCKMLSLAKSTNQFQNLLILLSSFWVPVVWSTYRHFVIASKKMFYRTVHTNQNFSHCFLGTGTCGWHPTSVNITEYRPTHIAQWKTTHMERKLYIYMCEMWPVAKMHNLHRQLKLPTKMPAYYSDFITTSQLSLPMNSSM